MLTRADIESGTRKAWARLRSSWPAVALTALAAALSWYFAHRVLGHPQPFFAPIAAAIALSTSRIQRSRRIAQMVGGVLLGIAIGELLAAVFGTSAAALGVIVFVTLSVALLTGVSFFAEGMMFANQAAASAILVVSLHRHGTGAQRAVDAIVGGSHRLPPGLHRQLLLLSSSIARLADAPRPWPEAVVSEVRSVAERAARDVADAVPDPTAVVAAVLRAAAEDLARVVEPTREGFSPGLTGAANRSA